MFIKKLMGTQKQVPEDFPLEKIAVIGAPCSGKSTLIRRLNMKYKENENDSIVKSEKIKRKVEENVLEFVKCLISYSIKHVESRLFTNFDLMKAIVDLPSEYKDFSTEVMPMIYSCWNDHALMEVYYSRIVPELNLPIKHFLQMHHMKALLQSDYFPSMVDLLSLHIESSDEKSEIKAHSKTYCFKVLSDVEMSALLADARSDSSIYLYTLPLDSFVRTARVQDEKPKNMLSLHMKTLVKFAANRRRSFFLIVFTKLDIFNFLLNKCLFSKYFPKFKEDNESNEIINFLSSYLTKHIKNSKVVAYDVVHGEFFESLLNNINESRACLALVEGFFQYA